MAKRPKPKGPPSKRSHRRNSTAVTAPLSSGAFFLVDWGKLTAAKDGTTRPGTGNCKPARQATFNGRFDQIGREKGELNRHDDLADTAALSRGDLFHIGDAGDDFIEPALATGDRGD